MTSQTSYTNFLTDPDMDCAGWVLFGLVATTVLAAVGIAAQLLRGIGIALGVLLKAH